MRSKSDHNIAWMHVVPTSNNQGFATQAYRLREPDGVIVYDDSITLAVATPETSARPLTVLWRLKNAKAQELGGFVSQNDNGQQQTLQLLPPFAHPESLKLGQFQMSRGKTFVSLDICVRPTPILRA